MTGQAERAELITLAPDGSDSYLFMNQWKKQSFQKYQAKKSKHKFVPDICEVF